MVKPKRDVLAGSWDAILLEDYISVDLTMSFGGKTSHKSAALKDGVMDRRGRTKLIIFDDLDGDGFYTKRKDDFVGKLKCDFNALINLGLDGATSINGSAKLTTPKGKAKFWFDNDDGSKDWFASGVFKHLDGIF